MDIKVSQSDTEIHIFGSGFGLYSWWRRFDRVDDWDYNADVHAPDGWVWRVNGDDPGGDGHVTKDIDHDALLRAFALISAGGGGQYVSQRCREECANVFADADAVDFDANTADEVVQVAVFGEVHYG